MYFSVNGILDFSAQSERHIRRRQIGMKYIFLSWIQQHTFIENFP